MAVPTVLGDLSTTASSNPPSGATSIGSEGIDDHLRAGYSFIAQLNANKAPLASPTFTGTVTIPTPFTLGAVSVTATGTELNYVDGVTSAIQTQLDAKAPTASPTFTGTVGGITATMVGLGNVTNESKATMFTSPTFTGHATIEGVTLTGATGTGNMVFSASPTFTGTVSGVTATHVGLGNVTNESKATMFTSPTFTGNTTWSSTSARLIGDFSNATLGSRALFQTSASNTSTDLGVVPNGSGDGAIATLYSTSDPTNCHFLAFAAPNSGGTFINSGKNGTGTYQSLSIATNNTQAVLINTSGYVMLGYGSSNGAYRLQVNSQIFATNATIATSDARYKENVKTVNNGLALVNALRPVTFTWKPQEDVKDGDKVKREKHNFAAGEHLGFIAQEVQAALAGNAFVDTVVKKNGREEVKSDTGVVLAPAEEFYGLAESSLIPLLVAAVQELTARIDKLEKP